MADTSWISSRILPLFTEGGRFHAEYEPPQAEVIDCLVENCVWQLLVFPKDSATPRILRVYRFESDPDGLLAAHWRNEARSLLRLSSRRHPTLPVLRDAALLMDQAFGYILIEDPGFPTVAGHPVVDEVRANRIRALKTFFNLVEATSLLHKEGLVHRSLTPAAICAFKKRDASVVIDGFQMSAFVSSWLRGQGALKDSSNSMFLPRSPHELSFLAPERIGPVFGSPAQFLEGYSTDVFSLGMIALEWFCGPDTAEHYNAVVNEGVYSEAAHRILVVRAHERLSKSGIPNDLRRLLIEMTSFVPTGRLPSATVAYDSLSRLYGALLAQMEIETTSDSVKPLCVYYLGESLQRIYQDGYGNSHPTSPDLSEYSSFIERDLTAGVLTWNCFDPPWEADDPRPARIALLGAHYLYLCQYLNQGLPDEDRRVAVVKFMVRAAHPLVRELRRRPLQRSLPPLEPKYFQEGGRQRSVGSTTSWQSFVESVESAEARTRVSNVEATLDWLLRAMASERHAREYPYEKLSEAGSLILRATGEAGTAPDVPDDEQPFVSLFKKEGLIEPFGKYVRRLVERSADEGNTVSFVVRNAMESDLPIKLEFDEVLDDWSVRFKSNEGNILVPSAGFIHAEDTGTRSSLRQQRKAVRRLCENVELVSQIQAPRGAEIFRSSDFPEAGIGLKDDETINLLKTILRTWPLYVVQGPPGTGKTFIAAQVIKESLRFDPMGRILVSAQSHHALDNILEEVTSSMSRLPGESVPLVLRIASKNTEAKVGEFSKAYLHRRRVDLLRGQIGVGKKISDQILAKIQKDWRKRAADLKLDVDLIQRLYRAASVVFATCANAGFTGFDYSDEVGSFDLVIIEEAARAWLSEVAVPLIQGNRWMVIGDQAQLPAFRFGEFFRLLQRDIDEKVTAEVTDVPANEGMRPLLSYFKNLMEVPCDSSRSVDPRTTLVVQRRMHPEISGLVSHAYYGDRLKAHASTARDHGVGAPAVNGQALLWVDTTCFGSAAFESGRVNMCEVQLARYLVNRFKPITEFDKRVPGICLLTPYLRQVGLLKEQVRELEDHVIHSIDSFQGRQAEIAVVSLVRNNAFDDGWAALGFLQEAERVNVLFSRARRLLVIIGSFSHFLRFGGTHWARVAEYIKSDKRFLISADSPEIGFRWGTKPPGGSS